MHKLILTLAVCLCVIMMQRPAHAHKVIASSWLDGDVIEGEIGLSNGEMAKSGTLVNIADDKGQKIGETVVTEEGLFRFKPSRSVPHHFSANLGAGHVANVVVSVEELPENLRVEKSDQTASPSVRPEQTVPALPAELEQIISRAVRKEVQPLRKEIARYKEKNDLQTILGGLGYIIGLTGIAFFIAAKREKKKEDVL